MPGWISFTALSAIIILALSGLLVEAPEIDLLQTLADGEILRIVRLSFMQAGLSSLISIALAIPLARALARRRFPGRELLVRLSSLSLVIPTMVAVLGIAAVHGRNGWINQVLIDSGHDAYSLYGLQGIIIAHVFFNLPLAMRIFLSVIESLPGETWRLSSQLGFSPRSIFMLIEWPLLKSVIPGVAGLIFLLCFTSFALVLTLGGGPKWSTLEVAIYQAIRFDFDIARGVVLAFIQIAICLTVIMAFAQTRKGFSFQATIRTAQTRPDSNYRSTALVDTLVIVLLAAFLLSPLLAVVARAMTPALPEVLGSAAFHKASITSIIISISAALLALLFSLPIAFLQKNLRQRQAKRSSALLELGATLILVVPPLTLGMGLFLVLRRFADVFQLGLYLVILINAMLAVPFLLRILQPAVWASAQQVDRLSASLGIGGRVLFWQIYWPQMRQAVGFALALGATLSLGDMGVIALFGTQELTSLPLLIYRLFGSYQVDQAAAVAMLLCLLCFTMFWGIETMIGRSRRAHS